MLFFLIVISSSIFLAPNLLEELNKQWVCEHLIKTFISFLTLAHAERLVKILFILILDQVISCKLFEFLICGSTFLTRFKLLGKVGIVLSRQLLLKPILVPVVVPALTLGTRKQLEKSRKIKLFRWLFILTHFLFNMKYKFKN
jgi:hypothetical protein